MRVARFVHRVLCRISDFFFGPPGPHDWMM